MVCLYVYSYIQLIHAIKVVLKKRGKVEYERERLFGMTSLISEYIIIHQLSLKLNVFLLYISYKSRLGIPRLSFVRFVYF